MAHPSGQKRSFARDSLSLLGTQFCVMLTSFVTGVVLARCLGPSGRGIVAAITVYPAMFISLTDMGVRQSSVFYLGKGIFADRQVVGAVVFLILMTSLLGLLVCGVILWSGGNPEYTPVLIVLAIAVVPLTLIKAYSSGIFLGKGMVGVFARLDRMVEVQKLLAVVVLVWLLSWGIAGALLASVLSGVVVAMYAVARVRRISPLWPRFDWPVIKALLSKGIVFAIALFVIQLNYRLDIALMDKLTTVKEIGIYTIGVGIAQLTWAFPQAITTVLFSRSANARDEIAFSQKVARLFRVTLIIALLLVVGLGLMASVFVPAFYGREFMASARVLQILLPGMFCMIALKILNMDLAGRGRPGASLWVMTPSLIANVLLNLYLIPRYGAYGAALSSSVSYSMGGIGMMLIYCRLTSLTLSQLWRYQRSDFAFLRRVRLQPVSVCADS